MFHRSGFHLNEQIDPTVSPVSDEEGSIIVSCMSLSECKMIYSTVCMTVDVLSLNGKKVLKY